MHFRQVPLRTIISWPHSSQGSPSKPFWRASSVAEIVVVRSATRVVVVSMVTEAGRGAAAGVAAGAADTAGAATQPRFPEESGMWGA